MQLFSDKQDAGDEESILSDEDMINLRPPDDDTFQYDPNLNPNLWIESSAEESLYSYDKSNDWEDALARQEDGSFWSAFENFDTTSTDDDDFYTSGNSTATLSPDDGGEEAWLDTLASITADEINFMEREADRADMARQMQERGFSSESISSTLGLATDDELERDVDNILYEAFKEETSKSGFGMYTSYDEVDLSTVESHTRVEWDDENNEPVRSQMVYVDEHTCIGCTNCAMIAQSTFFMESEHGRARVFQQWGDDDETIQVAIETCPVDCIHYVPYDELKILEIERRDQNINFKARLVNQGEYQASAGNTARYGGSRKFTEAQTISGNMGARCNNCPSVSVSSLNFSSFITSSCISTNVRILSFREVVQTVQCMV
jgi:ferredoxin